MPFVVRPRKNQSSARVVFLAPTLTWQAYANFNEIANPYNLSSTLSLPWLRDDLFIAAHPELGLVFTTTIRMGDHPTTQPDSTRCLVSP